MKKCALFLLTIFVMSLAVTADDSRYLNALKYCSIYSEEGSVNSNGTNATSIKRIHGWQNDRCVYTETVQMGGIKANVKCGFTKPQLQELSSVMDAYMLTLKYSGEDVDVSSPSAVQNNPVVKVWNKYMQNPEVCKVETEEQ